MEFVNPDDVNEVLTEYGIQAQTAEGTERVHLRLQDAEGVTHLHLADEQCDVEAYEGADAVTVPTEALPSTVENIIHRLHLNQVLLIPLGKWRQVFDCVAFSLAENEAWQEIDATATVELNSRDPLFCEPADFQTLMALVKALYSDGESPDQGMIITTTAAPLVLEIIPTGALRISMGHPAIADEVRDTVSA